MFRTRDIGSSSSIRVNEPSVNNLERGSPKKLTKLQIEQANKDGRPNLNADEETRFAELTAAYDTTQAEIRGAKDKLAKALQIKADEDEAVRAAAETHKTDAVKPAYDRIARVGSEERTYNPQSDRTKLFLSQILSH